MMMCTIMSFQLSGNPPQDATPYLATNTNVSTMVISTTLSIPLHLLSMPVIWLLSPLTVLLQICGRVLSLAVNSPVALISRFKVPSPPFHILGTHH